MWPFTNPAKLIRYLVVWRVNSSLARLPRCLSAELSLVLGKTIANRLPTRQAQHWRKALAPWDAHGGLAFVARPKKPAPPDAAWPVETVLFVYPGKLTLGQGETVLWELKLLGESADHGLFLETFLPAMEEAGSATNPEWRRLNTLWGHFDVQAVYAARGAAWEPFVRDGRLDLNYQPTPEQWAEGLTFEPPSERVLDRLTWLTPFDLGSDDSKQRRKKAARERAPGLRTILEALVARMSQLLPGRHHRPEEFWAVLSAEEQAALKAALELAARIPLHHAKLKAPPREHAGRWIGLQTFPSIPRPLIPYLELASILHIGRQTHFGCGTFVVR